ncbi:rhamnan synthesis F family protein [Poseidonocella sp. HB161398]|uniref:rhamnan synthesis F family protein n=1 Tax=Poseidonocella sp. HB161398 TaxID=2320855 RepID=UPI001108D4E9|nr:rhamnan synthesis F family protein [Poseidonocella sp. HB161398]
MGGQSKLMRELRRLQGQVSAPLRKAKARALAAWWQRAREDRLDVREGALPWTGRAALFLLYQPGGVAASTYETLAALQAAGYAPLVVCNGGVPAEDAGRLAGMAWRVIQRPNIGYDFGGYRDGLWYLGKTAPEPGALLILNDTVWLPATGQRDTLADLAGLGADYAVLSNFMYRPRSRRSDALVRQVYGSSFGMLLSPAVLRHPGFAAFWDGLPLYAEKAKVVELGEVGFSRAMAAAGFAPRALMDWQETRDRVAALDRAGLAQFLRDLPVLNTRIRDSHAALVARFGDRTEPLEPLRDAALELLYDLNPWDSLAVNGLASGQVDFVKKANIKHPPNAVKFLAMCDSRGVALRPCVRSEIEALAARKA